jgi:hypothetical protein
VRSPGSGGTHYTGTLAGFVRATDGVLVWQSQTILNPATTATVPLVVRGLTSQTANLQEWFVAGGPGTVAWVDKSGVLVGTKVTAQASGAKVEVYDTGGSVNSRRMAMGHSSGYLITLAEAFGEHPL